MSADLAVVRKRSWIVPDIGEFPITNIAFHIPIIPHGETTNYPSVTGDPKALDPCGTAIPPF